MRRVDFTFSKRQFSLSSPKSWLDTGEQAYKTSYLVISEPHKGLSEAEIQHQPSCA